MYTGRENNRGATTGKALKQSKQVSFTYRSHIPGSSTNGRVILVQLSVSNTRRAEQFGLQMIFYNTLLGYTI